MMPLQSKCYFFLNFTVKKYDSCWWNYIEGAKSSYISLSACTHLSRNKGTEYCLSCHLYLMCKFGEKSRVELINGVKFKSKSLVGALNVLLLHLQFRQ